jgi:gliding motility-associated-like protein
MRFYFAVFFCLLGIPIATAQNLLMNGSFEDSVYCGSWIPDFAEVTQPYTGISAIAGTVDYHSAACGLIPWNTAGYVIPQDGNAVVGFFAFSANGPTLEIPQVKLIQPLLADSLYRVSFYIYLADISQYAVNQIRVAMMVDSIYLWDEINNFHLGNSKVCWESNPDEFVDNRYWRQYAFDYVATGMEKFMAVSSLQIPANIIYKMVKPDATAYQAYYYIDNLQVVKVNKNLLFPNVFTPNGDGINDAWEPTIQGYPEFLLQVFNRWGKCVFQTRYLNEPWNGGIFNNLSLPCTEGVYYYLFQATHPAARALQSGTIHLFR